MRVLMGAMLLAGVCNPPPGLDEAAVAESVDEQRESLAECATETVDLEVRVHIKPDGWVEDVRARGSARVGPCVERVIESWRFPTAEGETMVELPIELATR